MSKQITANPALSRVSPWTRKSGITIPVRITMLADLRNDIFPVLSRMIEGIPSFLEVMNVSNVFNIVII